MRGRWTGGPGTACARRGRPLLRRLPRRGRRPCVRDGEPRPRPVWSREEVAVYVQRRGGRDRSRGGGGPRGTGASLEVAQKFTRGHVGEAEAGY